MSKIKKVRVSELAKELGTSSKVLLTYLRDIRIEASTPSSSLDKPVVDIICKKYPGDRTPVDPEKINRLIAAYEEELKQAEKAAAEKKKKDAAKKKAAKPATKKEKPAEPKAKTTKKKESGKKTAEPKETKKTDAKKTKAGKKKEPTEAEAADREPEDEEVGIRIIRKAEPRRRDEELAEPAEEETGEPAEDERITDETEEIEQEQPAADAARGHRAHGRVEPMIELEGPVIVKKAESSPAPQPVRQKQEKKKKSVKQKVKPRSKDRDKDHFLNITLGEKSDGKETTDFIEVTHDLEYSPLLQQALVEEEEDPTALIVRRFEDIDRQQITMRKSQEQQQRMMRFPRKRRRKGGGRAIRQQETVLEKPDKIVVEPESTVKDLSNAMMIKAADIIRFLMQNDIMVKINDPLPDDVMIQIALNWDMDIEIKQSRTEEDVLTEMEKWTADKDEDLVPRAPVVTFMGHIDHGKTSIMDRIRQANVAAHESGGITQHIGAYQVTTKGGGKITLLDTPGHEAFTQMRARGAEVTDLVVLVVAADDGVMPQTEEAISHARAAKCPIIVALNKIDKHGVNVDRVKQQLAGHELLPEDWGGSTSIVPCSALSGQGIDNLIEIILLEAEMLELRANPNKKAKGTVIDAKLDRGRGVVATVLVQEGTLNIGDLAIAGSGTGNVRAMFDDRGQQIKSAGPSTPVEVLGLSDVPEAGDTFIVLDDIERARELSGIRHRQMRERISRAKMHVTLENIFSKIEDGRISDVKVVLKCDVKGTLEVLQKSLGDLSTPEVKLKVIHAGIGMINENDVTLADASDAIVIGFHVSIDDRARELADTQGVSLKVYHVIYQLIDDVKKAMEGQLMPEEVEVFDANIEVRQIFKASNIGTIAGCFVTKGKVGRNCRIRLFREGRLIHEGTLASLKRFKDDVREVAENFECGLRIDGYNDLKPGDQVEAFHIDKIARTFDKIAAARE